VEKMKAVITRYPLTAFFVMAFLFSWIAIVPLLINPTFPIEIFQILGALAGPTLSAVIVIALVEGRTGLGKFFKRYIQWRAGIGWWLFILFATLISLTIVAAVIVGTAVLTEFIQNIGLILYTYLLTLIVGIILGPLWEEPGWRGFALPRLQALFGPLAGTAILGLFWAFWHIPGFLGGWMQGNFVALIVSSIAFSLVMTWVYNNTRGSILLMILLHSSSNAALSIGAKVLPANLSPGLNSLVYGGWIPAITYSLLALLAILVTRGRLAYPKALSGSPQPVGREIDDQSPNI
jgi:CAAX protease family protein